MTQPGKPFIGEDLFHLLDQLGDAAMVVDANGDIEFVNSMFECMLGYTAKEIIGKPLSILDVSDCSAVESVNYTLHQSVENKHFEAVRYRRKKNGEYVPVMVRARSLVNHLGEPYRYVGSYTDLSAKLAMQNDLDDALKQTIKAISTAVGARDPYTFNHQKTVSDICTAIARKMNKDEDFITGLNLGAAIHDIGKIQIPAEILQRPGQLSQEELALVKTHSLVGANIIAEVKFRWPIRDMILQHHERIDGSGYPYGLKGDEIILEAKIIAVADIIDAMASHRPYRPRLGIKAALDELKANRGTAFDPEICDVATELFERNEMSLYLDEI